MVRETRPDLRGAVVRIQRVVDISRRIGNFDKLGRPQCRRGVRLGWMRFGARTALTIPKYRGEGRVGNLGTVSEGLRGFAGFIG